MNIKTNNQYFDAHIHYFDKIDYTKTIFINSSNDSDWEKISKLNTIKRKLFLGIHPYLLDNQLYENNFKSKIDTLVEYAKNGYSIGEIGIDKLRGNLKLQEKYFFAQLEIASYYKSLVSIHSVKSLDKILGITKNYSIPIIFHSFVFDGSDITSLKKDNYFFSISKKSLAKKNFSDIIKKIPLDNLLVESDSIDGFREDRINKIVQNLSSLLKIDSAEIENRVIFNMEKIL